MSPLTLPRDEKRDLLLVLATLTREPVTLSPLRLFLLPIALQVHLVGVAYHSPATAPLSQHQLMSCRYLFRLSLGRLLILFEEHVTEVMYGV